MISAPETYLAYETVHRDLVDEAVKELFAGKLIIRQGGVRVTVMCDQHRMDKLSKDEQVNYAGRYHSGELIADVVPDCAPDRIAYALLHELLHHGSFTTGLRDRLEDGVEEQVVSTMTTVVMELLRSNPKLTLLIANEWDKPED